MKLSRKPTPRPLVGLDIDSTFVAVAEARADSGVVVERAVTAALAPDVVRDGEVVDPDALAGVLQALWAEHKLPRRVRLGVANGRIVMRTLDLPPLKDERELQAAVRFSAQDHVPMPLDQAVLDFQPLGRVDTPGGERLRVVVVAARRDMVERLLAPVRAAGLRPAGLDLSAFALVRALARPERDPESATLLLNLAGVTNLAVAEGTACTFARVVPTGIDALVADLAERRHLTPEHARGWLAHTGLVAPLEGVAGDPDVVAAARGVLAGGVARLADEIRTSLDFHRSQEGAKPVERAVVTGPAVAWGGLVEALGERLRLPVQVAAPRGEVPEADAARLAVASGLAVEAA